MAIAPEWQYQSEFNFNSDHKIPSSEDPFIHSHVEAASVYSLNLQVLSETALPHNPPPAMSSTHIHTN